jgi:radical SAM superfamily enzyme YgiQ (UPF0313 family)
MTQRHRLLLLQLPRLDPDVASPGENVMLAAACLQSSLERSSEGGRWVTLPTPAAQDKADNATLLASILATDPDAIGATLYLWNIERTLRLLAAVRQARPTVRIVVGGPEVAREHPLLFPESPGKRPGHLQPSACVDVAVLGEGETVFPSILAALRRDETTGWRSVAWRHPSGRFVWGRRPPPVRPLADLLPPPDHPVYRPDAGGMAYLETNRGCPMRCAFCCYNLRRAGWSSLSPSEIERRIRILRDRGAREIRLVDPTFNAHPQFRRVLGAFCRANTDRKIRFFVELRADTLTEQDARRLTQANVCEAEVGVQSTDPNVLRAIRRPTRIDRVLAGIERLQRQGIQPTIDFLYGLPGQGPDDIERSLSLLARFPRAHPQFLPLLLLPGTELRDRCSELGLRAQRLPPYRVQSTDRLSARRLQAVEAAAVERLGGFDSPTRRFVGNRLPDLFPDRVRVTVGADGNLSVAVRCFQTGSAPGQQKPSNRRAVFLAGDNLFAIRASLGSWIRKTVASEPDMLWQFVLVPSAEEPLDLIEDLVRVLRRLPSHWMDRLVSPPGTHRLAARRLLVQLPRGRAFDAAWRDAAESLLAGCSH